MHNTITELFITIVALLIIVGLVVSVPLLSITICKSVTATNEIDTLVR